MTRQDFLDGRVVVEWAETAAAEPLIRTVVLQSTGQDPGPVHHACPTCGSIEHGRPYVEAPVWVSVAHTSGLTVVAVSVAGPVGVDVEREAPREWVRREAAAKAAGTGLVDDEPAAPAWSADLDIPGHVGSVALLRPPDRGGLAAAAGTATPRRAGRDPDR
jgi:hypothetical protein